MILETYDNNYLFINIYLWLCNYLLSYESYMGV